MQAERLNATTNLGQILGNGSCGFILAFGGFDMSFTVLAAMGLAALALGTGTPQPLVSHWSAVGAFLFALGVGSSIMSIYFQVTMAEAVSPEMRGSAMALGGLGWGLSHLSTPLVMGFLADRFGIVAGFYVLGGLSLREAFDPRPIAHHLGAQRGAGDHTSSSPP